MLLSHLPKLHTHHHHHRHLFLSLKPPKPSSLYQYRPTVLAIFSSLATSLPSQNPESLEDPLPQISKAIPQLEIEDEDPPQISVPIEKLFIPPETNVSGSSLTARILKGSNIVLSNYARNAQVVTAEYIKSSVKTEQCPSDGLPEFALVGRSNVGKSSLLNSIVRRKKLALTSKKPGKTQCINHFKINDSWYLVDLPGYGYAMAPQDLKKDWDAFTKDYFLNRSTLVSVFLLVDATIPVKKIDIEYASWLGQNQIPMTLIFTKCDKRKKKRHGGKRPEENVLEFTESIGKFFDKIPPWIMTSSLTNQGRDEILLHMAQLRNYWLKH